MSNPADVPPRDDDEKPLIVPGVTGHVILDDIQSRYANVICPVHGVPPRFEQDKKGGLIETFCCEALAQIFLELRASEGVPDPQ